MDVLGDDANNCTRWYGTSTPNLTDDSQSSITIVLAQVDPPLGARVGHREGLELDAGALVDEQRFQHVLDPLRAPEPALDARPAPPRAHDGQVAGADVAEPLVIEHERDAGREVRFAHDQLAPPADLDDDGVCQWPRP